MELVPFRAAIEAGVDSIMTAHIAVPALGAARTSGHAFAGDSDRAAARPDSGFNGLVVTDALDMGGIVKGFGPAEAAVRALEAGADVLLMPADPEEAINGVMAAVRSGRISRQRLEQSVARILDAKIRLGLKRRRTVDLDAISDVLAQPRGGGSGRSSAHAAAERPDSPEGRGNHVLPVMPEGRFSQHGRVLTAEFASASAGDKDHPSLPMPRGMWL